MPEPKESQSIIESAEQAAAAGDYVAAEQLLREAARHQETELGPLSPELANTLNNLGVVSEIRNNPDEAERCYRRAYAIAAGALEPEHPFVATSRKNLTDLCAALGKPLELPTPEVSTPRVAAPKVVTPEVATAKVVAPEVTISRADLPPVASASVAPSKVVTPVVRPVAQLAAAPRAAERSAPADRSTSPAQRSQFRFSELARASWIVPMILLGLVVVLAITRPWLASDATVAVAEPSSASTPSPTPPTPPTPPEKSEAPPPAPPVAGISPVAVKKNETPVPKRVEPRASAAGQPAVTSARLCRSLGVGRSPGPSGDWPCDAASGSVASGPVFFYTRLKAPRDTTVQHRWYRDNQLYQSVDLRVRANATNGYRTYSRYTVNRQSTGSWRVELRSMDGTLLHQEKFAVP